MPETNGISFQELLNQLNIGAVVCIDDVYESRVELEALLVWAVQEKNRQRATKSLQDAGYDLDLSSDTAQAELRTILTDQPIFAAKLQASIDRDNLKPKKDAAEAISEHHERKFTDRSVLSRLDEIMDGFAMFNRLSPGMWSDQKETFLAALKDTKTLFIFDENLGDQYQKGTAYIREIAASPDVQNALFGLLSYEISSGQEHDITRQFQRENIVATAIPKRDLSSATGVEQLQIRLRAAVLWKESKELRETCRQALTTASSTAYERLIDLTPLEFDEVVFCSSYEEGAHEMDTLIRVYANAFATSLRESLRSNAAALSDIDTLRNYRGNTKTISKGSSAWKLQRDEYYEPGAYVNSCKMPPEPGDLYTVTFEDGSAAEYVFVAPPCDIVVRGESGTRSKGRSQALLCKVTMQAPDEKQQIKTFKLDHYIEDSGLPAWVYLTDDIAVDLWLLDLASINASGQAIYTKNADVPTHLSDGYRKYYTEVLVAKCDQFIDRWRAWQSLRSRTKTNMGIRPSYQIMATAELAVKTDVKKRKSGTVLSFGVRRTQRLSPILQSELIRAYSDYFSRPVRPHYLNLPFSSK